MRVRVSDAPIVRWKWRQVKHIHAPIVLLMKEVVTTHHQQSQHRSSHGRGPKPRSKETRKTGKQSTWCGNTVAASATTSHHWKRSRQEGCHKQQSKKQNQQGWVQPQHASSGTSATVPKNLAPRSSPQSGIETIRIKRKGARVARRKSEGCCLEAVLCQQQACLLNVRVVSFKQF